jgi:hypothetical protein
VSVEQLFAALRTQLTDAAKPGMGGVLALRSASVSLVQLEGEIALMRKRWADKEAVRLGHVIRHACTPEQYYAATERARAEHPEAWEGVRE